MTIAQKFSSYTREEFEGYLFSKHNIFPLPDEYYLYDWQIIKRTGEFVKRDKEIKEYIYAIALNENNAILVFSGISRFDDTAREVGSDALRLVPVNRTHLEPIRERGGRQRINRISTWRDNFETRLLYMLYQLGYELKCLKCNRNRLLRMNRTTKEYFLKCPKCLVTETV